MNNNLKFPPHAVHSVNIGHLISLEDCVAIPYYIIILATHQTHDAHREIVREVLSDCKEIHAWTIDMEDEDRVIRLVSQQNIGQHIATSLRAQGIDSSIMGIFQKI